MSNQHCKGCHVFQSYEEFLNEKGVIVKKCLKCRNNLKTARSKNKKQLELDIVISYLDITEEVYNSLISLNDTNEFYKENKELNMNFSIELSSLLDFILEKDGSSNKENHEFEIGRQIIASISISEGDGYSWVYRNKNKKKKFFSFNDAIFKKVQRNGNYPLISTYEGKLVNIFCLEDSQNHEALNISDLMVERENDYIIESSDEDTYEADLAYLQGILDKTKELLEESRNKPKKHLWLKSIRPNFKLVEKMNNEIMALKNRRTMPKTWKDLNKNTMYWE